MTGPRCLRKLGSWFPVPVMFYGRLISEVAPWQRSERRVLLIAVSGSEIPTAFRVRCPRSNSMGESFVIDDWWCRRL